MAATAIGSVARRSSVLTAAAGVVVASVALPAGAAVVRPGGAVAAARPAATAVAPPAPGCWQPRPAAGAPGSLQVVCFRGAHRFTVPAGVHTLRMQVYGASGGAGTGKGTSGAAGGLGAEIAETLAVAPGEKLSLTVGGTGRTREHGGFNGGGSGPHVGEPPPFGSGGGGGASDVRVAPFGPWQRVLVAAGGGGGGGAGRGGVGGDGGDSRAPGSPGLPAATGGAAGLPATSAGNGAGGAGSRQQAGGTTASGTTVGAPGGSGLPDSGDGGAGGGGYGYGGGGAGGTGRSGGGGGGGGSDYVNPGFVAFTTTVTHSDGVHLGDGLVVVVYTPPAPHAPSRPVDGTPGLGGTSTFRQAVAQPVRPVVRPVVLTRPGRRQAGATGG